MPRPPCARPPLAPRRLRPGLPRVVLPLALAGGALAWVALPTNLVAQGPRPVAVGATVRVLASDSGVAPDGARPAAWRQGIIVAVDSTGLALRAGPRDRAESFMPRARIREVEVRAPGSNRAVRVLGFGVLGGLVGAAAGGFIGDQTTYMGALVGIPVGGVVGLLGGALVGANTGARWVRARVPALETPGSPATSSAGPPAPAR